MTGSRRKIWKAKLQMQYHAVTETALSPDGKWLVSTVKTPWIQHGMVDEQRVPLEQGQQLYNALKRQAVEVEMAMYPRQHHCIAEPHFRIELRKRPVKWFRRWLIQEKPTSSA
ncbi:MAG: prolyl oligopeptidase family serine peptidase [Anaerolineae bacterium]|nr:prolyl oligopeptidase family serine peptidase [Anaerolineae bacterium]